MGIAAVINPIGDMGKQNIGHALNMLIGVITVKKIFLHFCKKRAINLIADVSSMLFAS